MGYWDSGKEFLMFYNETDEEWNEIPVEPHKGYEIDYEDCENINQTESGTYVRDIVRLNNPNITVNLDCDKDMAYEIRSYKNKSYFQVLFYDPGEDIHRQIYAFITSFKMKFLADASTGGIWRLSFILKYLKNYNE